MHKLFLIVFSLVLLHPICAQVKENPVKWNISAQQIAKNQYELIFRADIDKEWKFYSAHTPEGGGFALVISYDKDVRVLNSLQESEPHKKFNEIFEVDEWYFVDSAQIKQEVEIEVGQIRIQGNVAYQVCKEDMCMLLDYPFDVPLPIEDSAELTSDDNLVWFFLWGIGYGFLAILMPCVFPMIPMTVSFFMHGDASKTRARAKALFFGLSIVAIFTALGMIVSVFLGPDFINWLSTNWLPNILFFLIFMLFAASFLGAFELVLPSWMVNKSDKQADKGGYLGAFFMAFTLVLVSFSCTAPFVGNLLVEAARGGVLRPIVGMLGFSIALSLPFGFFAFFPSQLSSLPKSGGWLNSVKVIFGFIEIALGFKFLMVVDQTYHWELLDREIYLAIWITVFFLLGLYLMGKIKFKNDSNIQYISVLRLICIIVTFSFVVYLIPGMFGAPLKALAGYLPPQETIDFDLNRSIREQTDELKSSKIERFPLQLDTSCVSPKYKSIMKPLPHGIKGYYDYEQALKCAKIQDKPLFLDFTGHGCVNCREMEQSVWSDKEILSMLKNDYIVVALYVDDKTDLPQNEWFVSDFDGQEKRTIGKKNADFQIKNFNTNAQPNYVLLDSKSEDVELQNRMLVPAKGYDKDKEAFARFLKQGIEEYKKRNK